MKIRKTFVGNLPDNKIINTNSTSKTDTYSCKYLNERNVIVSSEEPTTGEEVWLERKKNLIEGVALHEGYYNVSGDITAQTTNKEMYSDLIEVNPNTTYTFAILETTDNYATWFGITEFNTNKEFTHRNTDSTTGAYKTSITTREDTKYISVCARNLMNATKIVLEEGNDLAKKIYTKIDNEYKELINISGIENDLIQEKIKLNDILNTMQPKSSSLKCRDLGNVNANETTTFALKTNWGFLFLYNEWGNGAIYAYDMKTAGGTIMTIYNIRENSMITVAGESGTRNVKFTLGQISCRAYDIYFQ